MKIRDRIQIDRRSFIGRGTLALAAFNGGLVTGCALKSTTAGGVPGPVVETAHGRIRGMLSDEVYAFRGVPYGASTTGLSRFMPPKHPAAWTGVRDALDIGPRAPQQLESGLPPEVAAMDREEPMSEDCLVLNVWTRGLGRGKRPVMVWLHGGGLVAGSAGFRIYDGANMAREHDVIVIGVNHRLNAFGYLYLPDIGGERYARASNAGQLDIIAALEWVRENVERFGGDPNNVTVFGQSGGGRKISGLLAMPAARGLYHRAIIQSGAALRGLNRDQATENTARLLHAAGLAASAQGLDALQQMPMDKVLELLRKAPIGFNIVTDGGTLPAHMFDPVAPQVSAHVPLLVGTMETEDTWLPGAQIDPIDADRLLALVVKDVRVSEADARRLISVYESKYPGIEKIDIYLKMRADSSRREEAHKLAARKADSGAAPAYLYYFMWHSPVRDGKMKAYHTLDIPFVWNNVSVAEPMTGSGADRFPLQAQMSAAWAAFARSGDPNHPGIAKWPAFDGRRVSTMVFDKRTRVVDDPWRAEREALAAVQRSV